MKLFETNNLTIVIIKNRDRNKHGGGLLFYINENIPCKVINDEIIPSYIEMIMFEFLVETRKWLCIGLYK